ncbi:hypothetical protein [Actinacidiphila sp. bgisy144]|uniref:hypothetical protein n=1 Tax=Actinacidiphila sp. bgisy144 TaxID=3413791 RepID=UPI003EB744DF
MEITEFTDQVGPAIDAALAAYGTAVLTRAEEAAVGATANLGRRVLARIWRRGAPRAQVVLEDAVQNAAEHPSDDDAAQVLRAQIRRALAGDAELLEELAALLPATPAGPNRVDASGARAVAAGGDIGTAVTGDNNTVGR